MRMSGILQKIASTARIRKKHHDHFPNSGLFLLVRPTGGITDMLCQIGRCISYGQNSKRYLVIDTDLDDFFAEELSNYFSFLEPGMGITHMNAHMQHFLNSVLTYPGELQGRLATYEPSQIQVKRRAEISVEIGHFTNLWDKDTHCPLTFDMRKGFSETLLVHHCSGGGADIALKALSFLEPTNALKGSIKSGLEKLPKSFSAIHVRNTDLKSDLDAVRRKIIEFGNDPVLICSDDIRLIAQLRKEFPAAELHSLIEGASYVEEAVVIPTLHKNNANLPRHEINTNMFIELIAMALSDQFYAAPLVENRIKSISGFSLLVQGLRVTRKF